MTSLSSFYAHPAFGVGVTLIVYMLSLRLVRRYPSLHPVLVSSACLIALLLIFRIPYSSYQAGGQWITFLMGPATVALAVPLYLHWPRIVAAWRPILLGVTTGTLSSIAANGALVWAFGGDRGLQLSMLSKSTTTPISIEVTRLLGGVPELAAVFTVITGLFGSMVGAWFLRRVGLSSDLAIGLAIGTAAHGIGTGRVLRDSELQGAYSGLAMALTGLVISIAAVPLIVWFR